MIETHCSSSKEALFDEMREHLNEYNNVLSEYESVVAFNDDENSPYKMTLISKLETARYRYFQSRMRYEKVYGDLIMYKHKLKRYFEWRREVIPDCLLLQTHYNELVENYMLSELPPI